MPQSNGVRQERTNSQYRIVQIIPAPQSLMINYHHGDSLPPVCLALVKDKIGVTYVATVDCQGDVILLDSGTHSWDISGMTVEPSACIIPN
ncbi:MAG: hypothetical protein AAGA75_19810 [Cyanobacteria bacterium P01_E01_bin.6]